MIMSNEELAPFLSISSEVRDGAVQKVTVEIISNRSTILGIKENILDQLMQELYGFNSEDLKDSNPELFLWLMIDTMSK